MTDFLSVDLSVALNIRLCYTGCHAPAPSTTSLLVIACEQAFGRAGYYNYIFSVCLFVCFVFTSSRFLLLR